MMMLTCVHSRERSAKGVVRRSNILKVGAMELERMNMSMEWEKHEVGRKKKEASGSALGEPWNANARGECVARREETP